MRQRLSGMILAAAWAGRSFEESLWSPSFLQDLRPRERFKEVWDREGPATLRVWEGFLAAAFGAALHESGQGHHVHFWLSEHARAWIAEWGEDADEEERRQLLILRQRLQDAFSLGINLRRRDREECLAALRELRDDPGFSAPPEHEPADALWEPTVAVAAASWSGRDLPRAFSVIQEMGVDAAWLAALAGLLFGRDGLLDEFAALGADDWVQTWRATEERLKADGRSVEKRVEELLS